MAEVPETQEQFPGMAGIHLVSSSFPWADFRSCKICISAIHGGQAGIQFLIKRGFAASDFLRVPAPAGGVLLKGQKYPKPSPDDDAATRSPARFAALRDRAHGTSLCRSRELGILPSPLRVSLARSVLGVIDGERKDRDLPLQKHQAKLFHKSIQKLFNLQNQENTEKCAEQCSVKQL